MSKKISREEFLSRFYRNYPEAEVEVVEYTAISNPAVLKCKRCGKTWSAKRARELLNKYGCCGANNITKIERLKRLYQESDEFEFVKQLDKDHFIVRHKKCGQELTRVIQNSLDNPFACQHCDTLSLTQRLSIAEVQSVIDKAFGGSIQILDYNGQLKKNHYKCLKCGMIFTQQQTSLMQSRGCPKCDRYHSIGERAMAQLLQEKGLPYITQAQVKELPLQKFDFAILDSNNQVKCYIEVQGEQHYEEREIFRDGLKKIQERDQRKRDYCISHNIPLYEIICRKGKLLNLDILPF